MKGKQLLLIDDDVAIEAQLRPVLEKCGYTLEFIASAADGLRHIELKPPDLILLDYSLPAYTVENFLADLSRIAAMRIPVVLLATYEEMQKVQTFPGVAGFVMKPVNTAQLISHLDLIFQFNEPAIQGPRPPETPKPQVNVPGSVVPEPARQSTSASVKLKGNRILLVDDDRDMVDFMTEALTNEGFEVITAYDGHEGLFKARDAKPDLILLDIMLPRMDGFQICRLMKFSDKYRSIPIIMLTARVQKEDRQTALLIAGADDYVTKPFRISEVLEKMRKMLTLKD